MKIQNNLIFIFLLCCFKVILAEEERCGVEFGLSCKEGFCCSKNGYCGNTEEFCGIGCQPRYGKCNRLEFDIVNSTGSPCGPLFENKVCEYGECCSKDGHCGSDPSYCGEGCQPEFGNCHQAPKGLVGPAFILPKNENGAKAITDIPPKTVPPRPPKDASDVKIITLRPPSLISDVKTVPTTPKSVPSTANIDITSKTLPPTPGEDIFPKTPEAHIIPKTLPLPPEVPKTIPLTPEVPKTIPLTPEVPKTIPLTLDVPKTIPLTPDAPKTLPPTSGVSLTTKTIPSSIPSSLSVKTIQPRPPSDLEFEVILPGSNVPPQGLKSSAVVSDPHPVPPEINPSPKTISKTTIIITTTISKIEPEITSEI